MDNSMLTMSRYMYAYRTYFQCGQGYDGIQVPIELGDDELHQKHS